MKSIIRKGYVGIMAFFFLFLIASNIVSGHPMYRSIEEFSVGILPASSQASDSEGKKLLQEGKESYLAGDFEAAIQKLSQAVTLLNDIDDLVSAWMTLSFIHYTLGDESNAQKCLKEVFVKKTSFILNVEEYGPKYIDFFEKAKIEYLLSLEKKDSKTISVVLTNGGEIYGNYIYSDQELVVLKTDQGGRTIKREFIAQTFPSLESLEGKEETPQPAAPQPQPIPQPGASKPEKPVVEPYRESQQERKGGKKAVAIELSAGGAIPGLKELGYKSDYYTAMLNDNDSYWKKVDGKLNKLEFMFPVNFSLKYSLGSSFFLRVGVECAFGIQP